jgi:hypothetical protein
MYTSLRFPGKNENLSTPAPTETQFEVYNIHITLAMKNDYGSSDVTGFKIPKFAY